MNLKDLGMETTILALNQFKSSGAFITHGSETVELRSEPGNPSDKDAIAVYLDGHQIGYVANSEKTVISGTISASGLKDLVNGNNKIFAKVDVLSVNNKNYGQMYKAGVFFEVKKEKVRDKISFFTGGGLTIYPTKSELLKNLTKGKQLIKVILKDGKLYVEYQGELCGFVKTNDPDDLELLKEYVKDIPSGLIATAIDVSKGNANCEVVLKKQVVTVSDLGSLDEEIERILKSNILNKIEIDERLDYLKACKVSNVAILNLFKSITKYPDHIESHIPRQPKLKFVDDDSIVFESIAHMNVGKNLLLEGEKGTGKNVLTETLAWLYCRPMYTFSLNSQHSNHSLLGSQTFENERTSEVHDKMINDGLLFILKMIAPKTSEASTEELDLAVTVLKDHFNVDNKKLKFAKSSIIEAVESGGIIVLDEFNTALAHVMPLFNSLLDHRRTMNIPGYGDITAHKNFSAIATQNKDYSGTFDSNEATVDRFTPIIFPSKESIMEVLQENVKDLDYDTMVKVNELYSRMRTNVVVDKELTDKALTVRGFIDACQVVSQGLPLKTALLANVANKTSDLDEREMIAQMIDLMFE